MERIVREAGDAKVIRTGYTVTVETERRRYLFSDRATSVRCFGAFARLRRDVLASGIDPGAYRPRNVSYYHVGDAVASECWCVDIKSAYPTALRKLGAITPETYASLSKLEKSDRLKAVGMLASRKFIQEYRDGRCVDMRIDEAPTAPFFYAACHEIGQVMEAVRRDVDGFLLYWVDGVFVDCPDATYIADTLQSLGYRTSVERVTDMRQSHDGRTLHYCKGGKRTYLCIPRRVEYRDAELIRAIENAEPL